MRRWWLFSLLWVPSALAEPPDDVIKAREAAAPLIAVKIDWPAAQAARRSGLPERLRRQADAIRLPVLLPHDPELFTQARLQSGDGWYAAVMDLPGLQLRIHALARTHQRPELAEEQKQAGFATGTPRLTRTHGIFSAAFERFGVGYVMEVECIAPDDDARCTQDTWLLNLLAGLAVFGGQP